MTLPFSWDERLNARGAQLTRYPAMPGNTYWRLVRGQWFDERESQGRHHIFVDLRDEQDRRVTGIPIRFLNGGEFVAMSEAKPGEPWAAAFGMYAAGCAYRVEIAYASDAVGCLGLGSIEAPNMGIHCSYGFVFQRTTQGNVPVPEPPPLPPTPPLPTPDPILDALAQARYAIDQARNALDNALELYSRQTGGTNARVISGPGSGTGIRPGAGGGDYQ